MKITMSYQDSNTRVLIKQSSNGTWKIYPSLHNDCRHQFLNVMENVKS